MTFVKLVQEDEFTENGDIIYSNDDYFAHLNESSLIKLINESGIVINTSSNESSFINTSKNKEEWKRLGISCLNAFVSVNFCGSNTDLVPESLSKCISNLFVSSNSSNGHSNGQMKSSSVQKSSNNGGGDVVDVHNVMKEYLMMSDETFQGIKLLPLLAMARYVLTKSDAASIWRLRYLIVHQSVLEQPNSRIYLELKRTLITFQDFIKDEVTTMRQHKLKLQVATELVQSFLWYSDIATAGPLLESISSFVGLDVTFSGALGRRTRYQEDAKSQLIVTIKRRSDCNQFDDFEQLLSEGMARTDEVSKLTNVSIKDDTVLDQIMFVEDGDAKAKDTKTDAETRLLPEEQSYLLLLITHLKRLASTDDELKQEELITFINYVINKTNLYPIRFKSLFLRSLIERSSSRRVERSMMQLDHLVEVTRTSGNAKIKDSNTFYGSLIEPSWVIEKHLADTLRSIGCIKAALDIYERLGYWEDVIFCYHRLDRKDKAEAVVRAKLESQPDSPYLWCLLGDATDELEHYEKSWKLSDCKYYKSMRAIGNYYFKRKNYSKCLEPFQVSLKLNSLQLDVWNRLAFAALHEEQFDLCVRAYRRYVEFEPDVFEAWNNMSKAYIKLGQKVTAFMTLQEAIKCNYDEWKLWDNYMIVSLDVGAFDEVIRSYHRLIDIKRVHQDDDVVQLVTDAVLNDTKDMNGNGASKASNKLVTLLARINTTLSSFTVNKCLFKLYQKESKSPEIIDKLTECIKKDNRAIVGKDIDWNKSPALTLSVLQQSKESLELFKELINSVEDKKKLINTIKFSYLNVIKTTELAVMKWDSNKPDVIKVTEVKDELERMVNDLIQ